MSDDAARKARNKRKALRKQRESGKPKGRRTDIPLRYFEDMRVRAAGGLGPIDVAEWRKGIGT